jgi:hypothetical protein
VIDLNGLVKRQWPRKPVLQPPLPDEGLVLDHEDGISLIADDEGLFHAALLLGAPVCLRIKVSGGLGQKILVQGGSSSGHLLRRHSRQYSADRMAIGMAGPHLFSIYSQLSLFRSHFNS